jgi:nitroreductase
MNMGLTDVIKNRRAIREYIGTPVARAAIERLISAAILAPSALNLQPWAFAVPDDRRRIGEYAGRIKRWLLDNSSQNPFTAFLAQLDRR